MKEWQQFHGHAGPKHMFRFSTPGDELAGSWQGTRRAKFWVNGVVASRGRQFVFNLAVGLRSLEELDKGTEVRIVFKGWDRADSGRKRKVYEIYVSRPAPVVSAHDVSRASDII